MWEILRHWRVYLNSLYSSGCLGRLWTQGPPQVWLLAQEPGPGIPSLTLCMDLLCRLTSVWVGGSVRCLVRGCLQGFLPAAVKHVPAVFLQWWGCQKTERRGGAAQVLKGAVIAISWRDSVLPFSSTLSPLPEIWLVIDQYGLKKWCQPELWIDLLLSVCHSFIAVLSQCVRAKAQHFCHLEKSLAGWCPQEQFPSAEGPRVPFLFTS